MIERLFQILIQSVGLCVLYFGTITPDGWVTYLFTIGFSVLACICIVVCLGIWWVSCFQKISENEIITLERKHVVSLVIDCLIASGACAILAFNGHMVTSMLCLLGLVSVTSLIYRYIYEKRTATRRSNNIETVVSYWQSNTFDKFAEEIRKLDEEAVKKVLSGVYKKHGQEDADIASKFVS
jgi:hypothetical protein